MGRLVALYILEGSANIKREVRLYSFGAFSLVEEPLSCFPIHRIGE